MYTPNNTYGGLWLVLLSAGLLNSQNALADHSEALLLDSIAVSAAKPITAPAVIETYTAKQIQDSNNAVTAAETLKYLPSLQVRERYIGDRNGIISSRTAGTVSSAQTLLYADGILLSNLLGNSFDYAPRWGMVSPEEIERVDVMYGPYSALYAGNSMGGVVNYTTRMPTKFEAHANLQVFNQRFSLYGTQQDNQGVHGSASIGNRWNDFAFFLSADHLDSHSQPMSFATATSTTSSAGTAVTGAYRDSSEKGQTRLVFGGYGIDHAIQDQGKLKLQYAISPQIQASYSLGLWQIDSSTEAQSYLRRADGSVFYNGVVNINGLNYQVSGLNPTQSDSVHLMQALHLSSDNKAFFDWQFTLSNYDYLKDSKRSASNFGNSNAGTIQDMEGTGWTTADARGSWHWPQHTVDAGYHIDHYALRSITYNTSDWHQGNKGSVNSGSQGDTLTQAVYAQDGWQFADKWKLTSGGRLEHWQAYDGSNRNTSGSVNYASKNDTSFSPKLALSFEPEPAWGFNLALGKAYRYATVAELFQSVTVGANLTQNNPDLKPEQVWSGELSAERRYAQGLLRATLFQENKQDALISQTITTGVGCIGSQCSFIQNVDKVRTRGLELSTQWQDIAVHGLDVNASLTLTDAEILKNSANPATEGKHPTRIPDMLAKTVFTYHQGDALTYSLAARYSGRQYYYLDNSDSNPGVYNSASKYFFLDARISYTMAKRWTASLGVDNLNNYKAYVLHPYPQRMLFAQLKFDY